LWKEAVEVFRVAGGDSAILQQSEFTGIGRLATGSRRMLTRPMADETTYSPLKPNNPRPMYSELPIDFEPPALVELSLVLLFL
jgi:hypothetical protein